MTGDIPSLRAWDLASPLSKALTRQAADWVKQAQAQVGKRNSAFPAIGEPVWDSGDRDVVDMLTGLPIFPRWSGRAVLYERGLLFFPKDQLLGPPLVMSFKDHVMHVKWMGEDENASCGDDALLVFELHSCAHPIFSALSPARLMQKKGPFLKAVANIAMAVPLRSRLRREVMVSLLPRWEAALAQEDVRYDLISEVPPCFAPAYRHLKAQVGSRSSTQAAAEDMAAAAGTVVVIQSHAVAPTAAAAPAVVTAPAAPPAPSIKTVARQVGPLGPSAPLLEEIPSLTSSLETKRRT